jgi:hypothetical protein
MKLKLFLILFAGASLCVAEQTSKLITLHYISVQDARSVCGGIPVTINLAPNNSLVLVGDEKTIAAAEAIIRQVDVRASKDIDLTAYMITASPREIPGRPLPPELDPVVKQLRSIFPYKSYTLLESAFLRVSSGGSGTTEGVLPNREHSKMPTNYTVIVNQVKVSGEAEHSSVHIGDFRVQLRIPVVTISKQPGKEPTASTEYNSILLNTVIDTIIGQKIVVGKSNIDGGDDALIVVLTAQLEKLEN